MLRISGVFALVVLFCSCSNKYASYEVHYRFDGKDSLPYYANLEYWAAHPWKKDPSDSLPVKLLQDPRDSLADVFFIYPTSYTEARDGWNASINDPGINAKTDYTSILYQASVFNRHARVFAPRYRQAHLSAFFADNNTTRAAFDTAYADLRRAFVFYLEHFNHNRPMIIAGHSQGGKMTERLLREFFDGKPLQQKLVAAYIVGWSIPQNIFDHIPPCDSAGQTGCFCGWRTFRKDYIPPYIQQETTQSFVTNPLTWSTSTAYAGRDANKGSVLRDFRKIIPHTTDAQIHGGVLWVSRPRFPGSAFYKTRNYHVADINLFYMNIRANVEQRIMAYLGNE
jgi:hypothetical protein